MRANERCSPIARAAPARPRGAKWSLAQKLRGASQRWLGRKPALPASAGLICPELFSAKVGARLPGLLAAVPGPRAAIFYDAISLKFPGVHPAGTVARFPGYLPGAAGVRRHRGDLRRLRRQPSRLLALARRDQRATRARPTARHRSGARARRGGSRRFRRFPRVLCVCTIEGRKNHLALLEACETLWAEGLSLNCSWSAWRALTPLGAALARLRALQQAGRPLALPGSGTGSGAPRGLSPVQLHSLSVGGGRLRHARARKPAVRQAVHLLRRGRTRRGPRMAAAAYRLPRWAPPDLASAMRRLLVNPAELSALASAARNRPLKRWPEYAAEFSVWMRTLPRRN